MKAIFCDRDGTLIVEKPGQDAIALDELELLATTLPALHLLAEHNVPIVIVTNQEGIANGSLSLLEFNKVHTAMLERIASSGIKILGTYMCPHNDADKCICRKPNPTMIIEAAKEYEIDIPGSYMIGDRITDVQAGKAAGTNVILLNDGSTNDEYAVSKDLLSAVKSILIKEQSL